VQNPNSLEEIVEEVSPDIHKGAKLGQLSADPKPKLGLKNPNSIFNHKRARRKSTLNKLSKPEKKKEKSPKK